MLQRIRASLQVTIEHCWLSRHTWIVLADLRHVPTQSSWQKTWNELFPPSPLSTHMLLPHASAHWESNSSSVLHFSQLPQWKKDMVAWRLLQVRDHHTFHLSLEVEAFHHQTNYLWSSHRLSLIDMVDSPVSLSSCLHPLQELSG